MTGKNPLDLVKNTAVGALSAAAGAAGSAIGLAQGAAGAAAGRLTGRARGADEDVRRAPATSAPEPTESPTETEPEDRAEPTESTTEAVSESISRGEPVNVTEELGLDPAPVAKPKGPRTTSRIDAAADPDEVDATPADVAETVARGKGTKPTGG